MNPEDKIYVAGHSGMVGSTVVRRLQTIGLEKIVASLLVELSKLAGCSSEKPVETL
jgi:GDP-L-fucose synthase